MRISLLIFLPTTEEIHRQLEDSDAKVVVGDTFLEKNVEAALTLSKKPTHVVINGPSSIPGAYDLRQILEDKAIPFADPVEVRSTVGHCSTSEDILRALPFPVLTSGQIDSACNT